MTWNDLEPILLSKILPYFIFKNPYKLSQYNILIDKLICVSDRMLKEQKTKKASCIILRVKTVEPFGHSKFKTRLFLISLFLKLNNKCREYVACILFMSLFLSYFS